MRCESGGRLFFLGVVAGSAMLFGPMVFSHGAQAGEDIRDLVLKGKPILDLRYRFEFVDQDNLPEDAKANTVRTRAGFETGRFYGLGAGADIEWIEAIGSEQEARTGLRPCGDCRARRRRQPFGTAQVPEEMAVGFVLERIHVTQRVSD